MVRNVWSDIDLSDQISDMKRFILLLKHLKDVVISLEKNGKKEINKELRDVEEELNIYYSEFKYGSFPPNKLEQVQHLGKNLHTFPSDGRGND